MVLNHEASCVKPVTMMVVTNILYSVLNILYKLVAVTGMNLNVFVAYRLMFSAAFMVPLAQILERKSRPKLNWIVLFQAFLLGLFGATLTQNLYIECLALTSPTFLAAMLNLLPGITFVMALCFRLENSSMSSSSHRNNPWLGFLAGLGSMVCFTTWLIMQAKVSDRYPGPYTSTALMSIMGSIQSVIFALCVERDWNQWKLGWDIRLWTAAYSGIMVSGVAVFLMSWCVQKRGPLFVSVFSPLTILIVALGSSLFLGEKFSVGSVLGGILVVCGLYIVLWGKSKELQLLELPLSTMNSSPRTHTTSSPESFQLLDEAKKYMLRQLSGKLNISLINCWSLKTTEVAAAVASATSSLCSATTIAATTPSQARGHPIDATAVKPGHALVLLILTTALHTKTTTSLVVNPLPQARVQAAAAFFLPPSFPRLLCTAATLPRYIQSS
ncbi:hypothetical protein M0R45_020499 [Rubus argutus]|uniref:EamA domain-containing protein n=1 Tax=Rubus argutus TaxID=59490 RepID=A0AAW1XBR3_RUBAR